MTRGLSFIFFALVFSVCSARAETNISQAKPSFWNLEPRPYNQFFSIQAGPYRPAALSLSNSNGTFEYTGTSLNSYLVEPGWGIELFHFAGAFYFEENLAISMFKAGLPDNSGSLSLYMLGADTRLKHALEWFPVRAIVPFWEVGYQYTFYSQSGPSDFESAQGSVGNFVAGAGVDLWINALFSRTRDTVKGYDSMPLFLSAKVNRVFDRRSSVDLGDISYMAGLSLGI